MANSTLQPFPGFQNFGMAGFPYANLLEQLAGSMGTINPGTYQRFGAGTTTAPTTTPANIGGLLGGLTQQGSTGNTGGLLSTPAPPQPYPTMNPTTIVPSGMTQAPGGGYVWNGNVTPTGTSSPNYDWTQGSGMWGNSTGPVNASSLTQNDLLFLSKWGRLADAGTIANLISGTPEAVKNAVSRSGAGYTGEVMAFDPSTYNGQLRPYFDQWMSSPEAKSWLPYIGTSYNYNGPR